MIEREKRLPLFCDTDMAARIERVEAQLIAVSERGGPASSDGYGRFRDAE